MNLKSLFTATDESKVFRFSDVCPRLVVFHAEQDDPSDMCLAVGILDNILMNAVEIGTRVIEIDASNDPVLLFYDGVKSGQLPPLQADGICRRLEILAGKYRGSPLAGTAQIDATLRGNPVSWIFESDRTLFRLTMIPVA